MEIRKLSSCALAVKLAFLGALSLPAWAADDASAQQDTAATATAKNKNDDVERIEVRGIRASSAANLNDKRFSDAVVDSITAEDIGKFPDRNVAESLQRVPGVTIQRQFGEGSSVSIRGAGPDFTLTTLNGQNVASTGWFVLEPAKRSFNYELLPSELVGNLEVYKSSQADLAEGGVGGTVIINTRKPLDLDPLTLFGSVEGLYTSDSGKTDPQYSGLVSWKNKDENLGILVSGVQQTRHLQRQGNEAFWQWGAGPVGFIQDRDRSAINATVQYDPTENLDFVLNYIKMEMKADNTNYALWLTQADTTWGSGTTEQFLGSGDNITPVKGPLNVAFWQARPREATMNSDVLDLVMNFTGDSYKLKLQAGRTTSSGGTDFEMAVDDGTGGTAINNGTYDFTHGHQSWSFDGIGPNNQTYSTYDPGSLTMQQGANFNRTPKTDDETYYQGDIDFDVDLGPIYAVKTGAKYSHHTSSSLQYTQLQDPNFNPTISTADLNDGLIDVGSGNYQIIKFDAGKLKDWAKASIIGEQEVLGSHSEIEENNTAAYVMAKYHGDNFRGNFGLRYVHTDATSIYYLNDARTNSKASYAEWLPSFNLVLDLRDDLLMRFAAARVMARPQYVDMYVNPSALGANDEKPNNQYWVVGNVGLKPFISDQFDVSLEWYFDDSSMASVALFKKDVKNFVTYSEYQASAADIPYDLPAAEQPYGWTVQEKSNGKDAAIEGIELQYQQDFGNGFGTQLNYTYTDTSTDPDTFPTDGNGVLTDSSPNAYNITGYYENDAFQVRLAYNWRDKYMVREAGSYGNRLHDSYGSLDLSMVYHLTDNIDLKLDGTNLTESKSKEFGNNNGTPSYYSGFAKGFPLYEYEMARMITFGVSAKF
ncbi:TonB-dependent receptor [Gallaecimonas kandeliae]|uniref:TonB-dependent receptor n=1 Tax=Gallaecimonas kandeliae TaxID=3029055 RepID=UPI00264752D2|nr:TonB-dependent receptor [Gallaecimonas kandeliae]WKE66161.1 TonB-dependent receptor [Gallaecimonas kandeliae]